MRILISQLLMLLASSSLLAFFVDGEFLTKEELDFLPGDVLTIVPSPDLPLFYRKAREDDLSLWNPNYENLACTWVQFAIKLDNTTLHSFSLDIITMWQKYSAWKVQSRASWGAQPAKDGLKFDTQKSQFALHHSDTNSGDTLKTLQAIQHDHVTRRGWPDIGYHFLISRDGLCYEGRPLCYKGAHVKSGNKGNIGICFIGCFEETEKNKVESTDDMLEIASELIAILAIHCGIHIDDNSVKGHQQFKGAQTKCPGNLIMRKRSEVISLAITQEREARLRL